MSKILLFVAESEKPLRAAFLLSVDISQQVKFILALTDSSYAVTAR